MNIRTQYKKTFLTTLLVTTFLVLPQLASAFTGETFFQEVLWSVLVTITGTILWICAMLFDFAVNTFVIGFGNLFLGSGIGVAVDRIWFILRDFVNMFFIFGLVYIGFKMILDADNSNTRRWLVNLIIAAVLINFSLFITKAVVDFSNQIATQVAISGFGAEQVSNEWGQSYEVNLADDLLGLMGIKDLLSLNLGAYPNGGGWGYIFGTAIFFLVTAFVMAAGAFILMIRFITLTLFMLVSPFMFISWVLPPVSDTMNKYWKKFLAKAFFAPLYFLFMYFSLETLVGLQQSLNTSSGGGKWAQTFTAAGSNTANQALDASQTTLPFFFIMCGFMIGSLMIAQKIGDNSADGALSFGKSLKNKAIGYTKKGAGAVTFGAAGRLGQATVGLGADQLSKSRRFQNFAANNKLGRAALAGTRKVADSSFDARRVGGMGRALGIGEGSKGGYQTRVKNKIKRDEDFFKSLDDADMDSVENKAKAAEAAEELHAEAGGVLESENKATADLTVEIDDLGTEIGDLTKALQDQIKDGTITSQEAYTAQRNIDLKTKHRTGMTRVRDKKLSVEILEDKINQAGLDASLATDPQVKAQFRELQQDLQSRLQQEQMAGRKITDEATSMREFDKDNRDTGKISSAAQSRATSEVKFENKIAYLEAKKRKFNPSPGRLTFNPMEEASHESLVKKYGGTATGMSKKSNDKKAAEKLAKDLAEFQKKNSDGDDKKKEGGGDKKDE